jgi:flagellar motor switch protein FliN/FliY
MGGEGKSDEEGLEEFYLSAISEVMNQMVGSSSTALANTLHVQVNISPPNIRELTDDEKSEKRQSEEVAIIISFRMEIEDLLVSNIMQIMPFDFGKKLAFTLNGEHESAEEEKVDDSVVQERSEESAAMDMESSVTQNNVFDSAVQEIFEESAAMDMESSVAQNKNSDSIKQEMSRESAVMGMESSIAQTKKAASTVQEISRESTVMDMGSSAVQNRNADREKKVELKSVQFQTFDNIGAPGSMASGNNIDLIIDVPLQVTVVLGKSKKNIKEILDLGMGSIIVLDRLAGEMVDVLVNGKMFARGEVVVINDNYGVRITELAESNQSKA